MSRPAITRAQWLHGYMDVLRDTGASLERELRRSGLPTWIEDMPDAYVSVRLAFDWMARSSRDMSPSEVAFLTARRQSLATFSSAVRDALLNASTGIARLRVAMKTATSEDSSLSTRAWRESDCIRLVWETQRYDGGAGFHIAEWVNQQAVVDCMRSIAGPGFCPVEMTFASSAVPCSAALDSFGNTRMLVGQPHTSMLVRSTDLERPCFQRIQTAVDPVVINWEFNFVSTLKNVIRPYLCDGHPSIGQVAEIVGMSARTLQRRLQKSGLSYSSLLSEVRVDQASTLLSDSSIRIIDISVALGFGDQQNFSRSFKQATGMTPSQYRRYIATGSQSE